MNNEDLSIQDDEINAIKSIYEEADIFSFDSVTRCGKFFAKQECARPAHYLVSFGKKSSKLN
jgi:hypothetical protein